MGKFEELIKEFAGQGRMMELEPIFKSMDTAELLSVNVESV